MAKFAKLFELENEEQVLVQLHYDEDDDVFKLSSTTNVDGTVGSISHGYEKEENAKKGFEKYDLYAAIEFRKTVEEMLA